VTAILRHETSSVWSADLESLKCWFLGRSCVCGPQSQGCSVPTLPRVPPEVDSLWYARFHIGHSSTSLSVISDFSLWRAPPPGGTIEIRKHHPNHVRRKIYTHVGGVWRAAKWVLTCLKRPLFTVVRKSQYVKTNNVSHVSVQMCAGKESWVGV
jgi:hypothetical protein